MGHASQIITSAARPVLAERQSSLGKRSREPAEDSGSTPEARSSPVTPCCLVGHSDLDSKHSASDEDDYDQTDDEFQLLEFDPYVFIRNLPPLHACVHRWRHSLLPRQTRRCKRQTLVLDLDETLVHSTLDAPDVPADFTFPVFLNNCEHTVHVRQRPHLQRFLETLAPLFEVVVFTASQKMYAQQLLNILDPDRRLIRHRVYRDSCVFVEGNYLKDLTVLGRDLARVIIVDNSPQAFGFQLANGVPIESWYDDEEDDALLQLLPFLEGLVDVDDVRPAIAATFRLHQRVAQAPAPPLPCPPAALPQACASG